MDESQCPEQGISASIVYSSTSQCLRLYQTNRLGDRGMSEQTRLQSKTSLLSGSYPQPHDPWGKLLGPTDTPCCFSRKGAL